MGLLLTFLPVEALPLILVVGGLAVTLGLARPTTLVGLVVLFALLPVLGAVVMEVIGLLPLPVQVVVFGLLLLGLVRGVLALGIGGRAADEAVGRLAYDLIRLPFVALAGLARVLLRRLGP